MNSERPKAFGRYLVEEEVGRGGMSVVYRATDPLLGRTVAVKVLHPHLAQKSEARRRFLQEAQAIARLKHPHILEVYDYAIGESEGEPAYIVSEFIAGESLRAFMERHRVHESELAMLIAAPIFEALQHAHDQGIIHRDVKPENILIRSSGEPVLCDFGIAHVVDAETLTVTGAMIGSPAHIAPELVDGLPVSERSDIYSMGTVCYWLCSGKLPFRAPNPSALFQRILTGHFEPLGDEQAVLGALCQTTERCMAREPEERPKSAGEVAEILEQLLCDAGLSDPITARASLIRNPTLFFQEQRAPFVEAYLSTASEAWRLRQPTVAIDRLDRALALDPEHTGAQQLLKKIKRVRGLPLRLSLTGLLFALPLAAFFLNPWGEDLPASGSTMVSRDPVEAHSNDRHPAIASVVVSGETPALIQERAPAQGERVSQPVLPEEESPLPKNPQPDLPQKSTSQLAKRAPNAIRRSINRQVRPARTSKRQVRSASERRRREVQRPRARRGRLLVSSRSKGALIKVDGVPRGRVYEIERRAGLQLDRGRSYQISFHQPACKVQSQTVSLPQEGGAPPRLVFSCAFQDARFRLSSSTPFEIFERKRGRSRRLGFSGQELRYPMRRLTAQVELLLLNRERQRSIRLELRAGELVEQSL
ncbi:MAG: serine/threonine-protein kinase [Myxococcota bacterium]|nr:serine/threonine-protein kinase [Myxococcota bacterium]